jgi:hypothetical protein
MLCGVTLTGCAQLVDMDDQQSDMVAEYMAGSVLRHTENYDEALIYPESTETEETNSTDKVTATIMPTTTPEVTAPATKTEEDNAAITNAPTTDEKNNFKKVDFSDFMNVIGKDKLKITYNKYNLYDSYPDENDYFTIVPSKGKQLLILTFNVKNVTNATQVFNLSESQIVFELESAEGKTYNPMMTLLTEDIQYINLKIGAGKSQKAVIVFDVLKSMDKSKMKLNISYKDKTTTLDLNQ